MVPFEPRKRWPRPKWEFENVDCQTTINSGYSSVTLKVSGTWRPSFSLNTPPVMTAAMGSSRVSAEVIHAF